MIDPEKVALGPALPGLLREAAPRVAVVGDFLLDGWWRGRSERMCREAPAPVIDLEERAYAPGGAANTAMNLAALGAHVCAVGLIGADDAGRTLRGLLAEAGVDVAGLCSSPAVTTTTKVRIVGAGQVLVRIDETHRGRFSEEDLSVLQDSAVRFAADADALVICDYDSGSLSEGLLAALAVMPVRPLTVVDAHDPARWRALAPDLVTPNAAEAARVLGASFPGGCDRPVHIAAHAEELLRATGAAAAVVTLDRDGTVLLRPGEPSHRTFALPAAEKQASGAGDTFVAALTVARAAGLPLALSADLAQAAADIVVQRPGTSVCSSGDLVRHLGRTGLVLSQLELAARLGAERQAGKRVVLTNGCFDVLHRGHTTSLNQARQLGDVLVVGVNSDESTRRLKGPGRPVNSQADRASLLSALACVDYVTVFDTDTAVPLIEMLQPDVYAKGGDYTPDMLAEGDAVRAYGGEVRILDYVPAQSTTAVVQRILGADDSRSEARPVVGA
ncbi:MAG: bifunctional heptose 7-phosphate kinase/heptose 1-phosphate adenyltransferase [Cryobacterium sp.]|nr:bifunctional heptose 7-phosphate kinase/heptose 1-phosphate adenyltransferase [Cryobacterium sp.]